MMPLCLSDAAAVLDSCCYALLMLYPPARSTQTATERCPSDGEPGSCDDCSACGGPSEETCIHTRGHHARFPLSLFLPCLSTSLITFSVLLEDRVMGLINRTQQHTLEIKASSAVDSGLGVFIKGSAPAGTVMTAYYGVIFDSGNDASL